MTCIETASLRPVTRTPESDAFWDAANAGHLLYGQCHSCDTRHYYPRALCPTCLSTEVTWPRSGGTGHLMAFSLFRRAEPPYISAWITLDEGVSLFSNLIDCDSDCIKIGDRVEVVFHPALDGQNVPLFRPAMSDPWQTGQDN